MTVKYPNSACEAHRNVTTSEPVCVACLLVEVERLQAELVTNAQMLVRQHDRNMELETNNSRLAQLLNGAQDDNDAALLAEVERLRGELAYYENPALYTTDPRYGSSESFRDSGQTARRALDPANSLIKEETCLANGLSKITPQNNPSGR